MILASVCTILLSVELLGPRLSIKRYFAGVSSVAVSLAICPLSDDAVSTKQDLVRYRDPLNPLPNNCGIGESEPDKQSAVPDDGDLEDVGVDEMVIGQVAACLATEAIPEMTPSHPPTLESVQIGTYHVD